MISNVEVDVGWRTVGLCNALADIKVSGERQVQASIGRVAVLMLSNLLLESQQASACNEDASSKRTQERRVSVLVGVLLDHDGC